MKYDLSIVIPARNEMFISNTVEDILKNKQGKTEVIVVLDGQWADPGIDDHQDVRIIYLSESIGQRAATNLGVRLSEAKYIIKCDAHCAFDEGFDVKMIAEMHDDWTMVPIMRNLHAFNWKCMQCGKQTYQGPTPKSCEDCDNTTNFKRKILWYPKPSPQSKAYTFDKTMHFQYFKEFSKRPEGKGDITPTMSLQGSFFMLTREKYWELDICDEEYGSWGQQGVEVALKTWLSGGKVMVNQKTWYAHMFRTQGGDFGFPYKISNKQVNHARERSRDIWKNNKWPLAKHDLQWLIDKFEPPDWPVSKKIEVTGEPTKGMIYYTDNQLNLKIAKKVQKQLKQISEDKGIPIVSTSLKPMDMGKNIVVKGQRGYLTMFKQILTALENLNTDIVFFAEHDVLYAPEHFDFTPPDTWEGKHKYYYNQNFWKIRDDGFAVHWDANQVSGLCCYREQALTYYLHRVNELKMSKGKNFDRSYEPGGRDKTRYEVWNSPRPNIDYRHGSNLTGNKWSPNDFRDKSTCVNWQESDIDNLPGWPSDILS